MTARALRASPGGVAGCASDPEAAGAGRAPVRAGPDPGAADRAVLSRHGRSFRLAGRLLGQDAFDRAAALYAACRAVDDLADEAADRVLAGRALRAIRADLDGSGPATATGGRFRALEVSLPAARLLVDTMLSDLQPVRIADQAALLGYAHGAAGTVGLMMCDVLGVRDAAARARAVDLGIAMQLTNIARDVREDAERDRLYLPAGWLPDAVRRRRVDGRLVQAYPDALFAATRRLLALAERRYRSGALGYPSLPGRARLAIPVAAALYREIGLRILRAGPDYLRRPRLVVGPLGRGAVVARCLATQLAAFYRL